MLLALHNCYHITLLKATMYRSMSQELEGYEIEAHTTCIIHNETVGYMSSEFGIPSDKLLCGIPNVVRMLKVYLQLSEQSII